MITILVILAAIIAIGVVFVTLVSWLAPARLTTPEGNFNYGVASIVVFAWWASLIYFLLWCLTYPARKLWLSKKPVASRVPK